LANLLDTVSKFALFSVSGLEDEKLIKSKPTRKLKHANSILEYFEYFCQMSSKLILIFSSYIVSNLVHFFWYTVYVVHIQSFTDYFGLKTNTKTKTRDIIHTGCNTNKMHRHNSNNNKW